MFVRYELKRAPPRRWGTPSGCPWLSLLACLGSPVFLPRRGVFPLTASAEKQGAARSAGRNRGGPGDLG
jgi:hypothetical protein